MTTVTKRFLLPFLISLCVESTAMAQTQASGVTLFGKVRDAQSKTPLPYLSLQLLTEKDSAFVADFSFVSTDYLETQVVRVGYSWKF